MAATAVDIQRGGSGEYDYVEGVLLGGDGAWIHRDIRPWYSAGGARKCVHELVTWKAMPILEEPFLTSHYPITSAVLRPTSRGARVVLVVRNLVDQLSSWARHGNCVDEERFLAEGYPERAINFCNFWGDRLADSPHAWNGLIVRYEDLISDSREQLQRILDFWGYGISSATVELAASMSSREAMERKVASNPDNKRITVPSRRTRFSTETNEAIRKMLQERLRHTFGYDYG